MGEEGGGGGYGVHTMTAVGVARPTAQGQAMTRVDIPKSNAKRK